MAQVTRLEVKETQQAHLPLDDSSNTSRGQRDTASSLTSIDGSNHNLIAY